MAQPWANEFYHTKAWLDCRAAVVAERLGICESCGGVGTEVHHVIALTESNVSDPEIALGKDNLQLLCFDCHEDTKWGLRKAVRKDVQFDEHGNPGLREGASPPFPYGI